ncbi:MAG: restriction endonuclease subunit M [Devosia sp. 67-54]|uniref:HsdM family class I SAM-dependent methyltransferase n=1 Tax=unclassified Devosia TaxID=196773 RepID=UPI0009674A39|nr:MULTISPECIES: N-6 DNA methylase [unclassified Devosia]MBN9307210.1 N-6 DNA methylase [Devosia sp.]OJX19604.1 MAG: restriction endonuclease subunit M [Devosia sp. 67-54]
MTDAQSLTLGVAAHALGWPEESEVLAPTGAGPATFVELANNKIGRALDRLAPDQRCRIGVLSIDPTSDATEAPLGLVVEFASKASDAFLRELHRLAWNFSHSPVLITIEPHLLRVWSCCEAPVSDSPVERHLVHQVDASELVISPTGELQARAARALHWLNLVSGHFLATHAERFDRNGRADQMLLQNLSDMREQLRGAGLTDDDVSHDLLARVIFVQFLFDRRDTNGAAALDDAKLAEFRADDVLSRDYRTLPEILDDYEDTYRLFDWLNVRFNGDLFPGKGATPKERAAGWRAERALVTPAHLRLLADFLRGDVILASGQMCLWPLYSFDVIPLEFISSIYETFVTERASDEGIFYTPPHLVDFVLDQVLPWNADAWDLQILDPACGSGIFLVKAFQRLVHRWKRAHSGQAISADVMRRMLTENLLGVDKDQHAVRVACFSLYLAMCDEIEPRRYWTEVHFPPMRGSRLVCSDFFKEGPGFVTPSDTDDAYAKRYDLIIGNAPWGKNLLTESAREWSADKRHPWSVANKDIGCLFLAKGAALLKPSGRLSLIQSAASLLFNGAEPAVRFRQKLFSSHTVDAIFNLSALRFRMFVRKRHTRKVSVSPSCVVVLRPAPPAPDARIAYVSPKAPPEPVEGFAISVEPSDYRWIGASEAASEPFVWTALMWGTPRDITLLRKLRKGPTLAQRIAEGVARTREGIIFGDRTKPFPHLVGRRLFSANRFPSDSGVFLDAENVPEVHDVIMADGKASTNFAAFALPQLLIKQGWQLKAGRFQARLVRSAEPDGLLCTQSYVTVTSDTDTLASACITYNSKLAVYFLQLTSGRMASYRPETTVGELLNVPLPPRSGNLDCIRGSDDFDSEVFDAFALKDAERVLIEDMVDIHIADFRSVFDRPGLRPTRRSTASLFTSPAESEPVLTDYALYFTRVLKAGFGAKKGVQARIFCPPASETLPFRLVSFELVDTDSGEPSLMQVEAPTLVAEMQRMAERYRVAGSRKTAAGLIARVYDGHAASPTIFMMKPDAMRYWTRSAALNDADEVSADLFQMLAAARSSEAFND